jgi:thymidylate kinase
LTASVRTAPDAAGIHPLLGAVFAALDAAGVAWCLLRGTDDLAAPAGDVDLLVEPRDAAALPGILEPLGFARMPAFGYGSHAFHLTYDPVTDRWLKLDVVSELAFGRAFALRSAAAPAVLSGRRRGPVTVPADGDAFWCLLLHRLLDKGSIAPGAQGELRRLAMAPGCRSSALAAEVDGLAVPHARAGDLVAAARRGDWSQLEELAPALARAWHRRRSADARRRRALGALARPAGVLARARRGATVALVGPDGAGKSTTIAALQRSFYFPARVVYMGPDRPRRRPLPPGIGLAARVTGQLGRWLLAMRHRARGRLVLFDRYAYDALLPPRRTVGRIGRLRRWLLGHACPPPGLIVVLDAPGDVLFDRKGELSPAVLEAERKAYAALARRRRTPAVLVDAARDADGVRRDITAAIWATYRRRWS